MTEGANCHKEARSAGTAKKEILIFYLDCGNPRCGFARIRYPEWDEEYLLMFSCRTRGFCPSCHAKHLEEGGEWMRETLLLDIPHRQVVFTVPKMLRIFFKYKRRLWAHSAARPCGPRPVILRRSREAS